MLSVTAQPRSVVTTPAHIGMANVWTGKIRVLACEPILTRGKVMPDSGTVMVDGTFLDDFFEQDRSWDDFGTTISGIQGTHQNSIGSRMPFL